MQGPDQAAWSQPLPPYTVTGMDNAGLMYPPNMLTSQPVQMYPHAYPQQLPTNTQIVLVQQQQQSAGGIAPQSYLVWSIFTCLCLFWPLGIPALVFSSSVQDKWARGDVNGALESSLIARNLNIAGTVLGFVWILIVCIAIPIAASMT